MNDKELIPHLFRTEYSKITAVLCKVLGIDHIATAEDIASETFALAYESWTYKGIPENPTAWLYTVAKNKAKNQVIRKGIFNVKIVKNLKQSGNETDTFEIDLSTKNITDSQLQMLFAICHPSISIEAQIGLSLRILCGFGIDEIANAFLSNAETIGKRLQRAKEKLREEKIQIVFPGETEIETRLETVLRTLYLLFNEGYYSESKDVVLREDLCLEAMRLTYLLIENDQTNTPAVSALLSLMCFHSSRFPARKNENGEIILYQDQDESLWNRDLIAKGSEFLKKASQGNTASKYHYEASIAYWHTFKNDSTEKWENILQLYNKLLFLEYSPVAALNRTFALYKAHAHLPGDLGKKQAIAEAEKLQLTSNHYYFTLLGILYQGLDQKKSRENLEKALTLAKSQSDKKTITRYLASDC
ncbi:RNA polymerase subunit sigma-24 [Cytophagales bacterium WSM2-2]|nr:RNA polymerase subunit sigma-24 [Cytophagales bacterium WSM2-2]